MSSVSKDNIKNLFVTSWLATKKVSLRVMGSCPGPPMLPVNTPKMPHFATFPQFLMEHIALAQISSGMGPKINFDRGGCRVLSNGVLTQLACQYLTRSHLYFEP